MSRIFSFQNTASIVTSQNSSDLLVLMRLCVESCYHMKCICHILHFYHRISKLLYKIFNQSTIPTKTMHR